MTGNTEMIQLLLDAGADVNIGHFLCISALHACVIKGNIDGARLLVSQYGADVNIRDTFGNTPLMTAVVHRNKEMVGFLISKKALKCLINTLGISAMLFASFNGFSDIAECLYEDGDDLELSETQGWTPLMASIQKGDVQTVQFLLSKGALTNAVSKLGATPLMIASGQGKSEIVSILINSKAALNAVDVDGRTSLAHAAIAGQKEDLETLLMSGAEVDKEDSFKRTPLMYAVQGGNLDILKLLIQYKADCSHLDMRMFSSLMISAEHGFIDCVKVILDTNVNVNDVDEEGNTALHFSSLKGHHEVVKLLIHHNANPNRCNTILGTTPLMLAAVMGHVTVVEVLVNSSDIDLNMCDKIENKTALIYAVQFNRLSVVKLLLEAGADINASTTTGLTALHLSVIMGYKEIVDYLLLSSNINVDTELKDGNTPLLSSVMYSRHSIIKTLIIARSDLKKKNKRGEDALTISLNKKCLISIKIILENSKVAKHRRNDLIQKARQSGLSEIADFIEQFKTTTTEKFTQEDSVCVSKIVNVSSANSQQVQDIIAQITLKSSDTCQSLHETIPSDVTYSLPLDGMTTDNAFSFRTKDGTHFNQTSKITNLGSFARCSKHDK